MSEQLLSIGLDVGTTSTQLILSRLTVENKAGAFAVPELDIADRRILYRSPIHFTPLLDKDRVDGDGVAKIVAAEYAAAGISRADVDTGAIIITGETSRKENARAVLDAVSAFAGDFVVATAGPDLESVLAAKGAGAVAFSEKTGGTVLHMDIGGGTSNLALIRDGQIVETGCLNVGGRLIKFDKSGTITYISPVLQGIFDGKVGEKPASSALKELADTLVSALEMAAGLRENTELLDKLWTKEGGPIWASAPREAVLSFSGGVADCIETEQPDFVFGDMGPILGRTIRQSRLCRGQYRLGEETIRATVIGAGSHSAQLSGSTVFYRGVELPLKNLPVVRRLPLLKELDGLGVLALPGTDGARYDQVCTLADEIVRDWTEQPVMIALEADMAKALGHALALRLPKDRPVLCIDRVRFPPESYLDIGKPVGAALPVVVKTLILNR